MIKNSSKLVLLLSLLVLGSCGTPSSSEQPSSSTPSVTSETSVSSNPSSSEAPSSESAFELEKEYTSATWPETAIAYVLDGLGIIVPSYTSENPFVYAFYEDKYGLYIEISTQVADISSEDVYSTLLENAQWIIDASYYEEYGFFAADPTGKVEVQYFWTEGDFVWYVYPAIMEEEPSEDSSEDPGSSEENPGELQSVTWPANAIATYLGNDVSINIPSLPSSNPYFYGVASEEGFEFFFIYTEMAAVEATSGFFNVEDTYNSALLNNGWVIDDADYEEYGFFAVDANETVILQYYWWDGYFYWYVIPFEEEATNRG